MSDPYFRTDAELDAELFAAEDKAIAEANPESERDLRISYWLKRFKSFEQACALADTELALVAETRRAA